MLPRTGKSGEGTCSDREYNGTDMSSSSSLEFSKWVPGPAASVGRDLLEMQVLGLPLGRKLSGEAAAYFNKPSRWFPMPISVLELLY